jgi:hypothetical protein
MFTTKPQNFPNLNYTVVSEWFHTPNKWELYVLFDIFGPTFK